MILYVFDQYRGNKTNRLDTKKLVSLAIKQYADEVGLMNFFDENNFTLSKTLKGKPFIEGYPLHFSVSHSEYMWVCLVSDSEIGVDIQNKTHTNFEAISRRFFQAEEQKAVVTGGLESFIAIWCRKEAFIKLLGMTIGDTIDWLNVAQDGKPASKVMYHDRIITFSEVVVHPEFLCVAAVDKKEDIWIRRIKTD